MKRKILLVAGARPNFMKIAPLQKAIAAHSASLEQILVHTGQHYDASMSDVFFQDLEMTAPAVNLEVGSGTHAQQTAEVMVRFEPVLMDYAPDWVVVPGDINSTMACTLVAAKLGFRVAHLEAGLRSFDRTMPEEINRLVTDQLSDLLLTPSSDGDENLKREGVDPAKIHMVGNIMIDSLLHLLPKAEARAGELLQSLGLEGTEYILATMHRPANVDQPEKLIEILESLNCLAEGRPVVMPVHPRTRQRIEAMKFQPSGGMKLTGPMGYLDFLALERHAALVITDSGGVQEETTFLGVPCLTVRPNTERPVTITLGTNRLVDCGRDAILAAALEKLRPSAAPRVPPPLWDGATGVRVAALLESLA
jgi:UDP-N-acetylglucosamine 2-epimerase (non-hydrolysing)